MKKPRPAARKRAKTKKATKKTATLARPRKPPAVVAKDWGPAPDDIPRLKGVTDLSAEPPPPAPAPAAPAAPAPHVVFDTPLALVADPNRSNAAPPALPPQPLPARRRYADEAVSFMSRRSSFMALGFVLLAGLGVAVVAASLRSAFGLTVGDIGLGGLFLGLVAALPAGLAQMGYTAEHFARRPA